MSIYKIIKGFYDAIGTSGALLGIDHGQKKIGLGISDPARQIAFAYEIIINTHNDATFAFLKNIVETKNVSGVVIGLPLTPSGEEGESCKRVMSFCDSLCKVINLPIFLQDERFSTKMVRQHLLFTGMKSSKKQIVEDKLAAANILQTTLDQMAIFSRL